MTFAAFRKYLSHMNILRKAALLFAVAAIALQSKGQEVGLKTNLLYWATTTPNIGLEVQTGRKHTFQMFAGLNPWKFGDNKKLRHWVVQPEYRYWLCQTFNGWFLGAHLMGGQFNAGGVKLPFGLVKTLRDNRYEGWYAGGGVTAGYQWPLAKHWNLETSIGIGYDYLHYDKFECKTCGNKKKTGDSHYVGPTKAALELIYMF